MDIFSIKIRAKNLIASGQEDYYIKIIMHYFDLIKDIKLNFVRVNGIIEDYIEEYNNIIIYLWEQRKKSLSKNKTA